ncbi:MAG: serpin family protein, partial [Gammaproteobacteria bacterium]|nr:serpin family protein [Gemmatimonadota bacterium]NIU80594.1 serpin family protein [Gammaproteobacteria bacterium]
FKGDWTEQFDPGETRTGSFTTVDGGTVDVDMMRGELEVGIGGADGVVIGELRYGGAAYVMDVVLPTGDGTV